MSSSIMHYNLSFKLWQRTWKINQYSVPAQPIIWRVGGFCLFCSLLRPHCLGEHLESKRHSVKHRGGMRHNWNLCQHRALPLVAHGSLHLQLLCHWVGPCDWFWPLERDHSDVCHVRSEAVKGHALFSRPRPPAATRAQLYQVAQLQTAGLWQPVFLSHYAK